MNISDLKPTDLIDSKIVARMLGVSTKTIERWRLEGIGPQYVKLSKRVVRYKVQDVSDYVNGNIRRNT